MSQARLAQLARSPAVWLVGEAPDRDIVLSSRVRLARNLQGHPFTHLGSEEQLRALRRSIVEAVEQLDRPEPLQAWAMEDLTELERRFLLERHLVSVELVRNLPGRALLASVDESEGIMVNEEDHLRVQALSTGLTPERALRRAMEMACELDERVFFAYDDRLGFLTACPTNVGTGLRASILLHLPGLAHAGDIDRVLNSLRRLNYTVRGFYGEGSGVIGGMFQVSNSVTLGQPEETIVEELLVHTRKVIDCERQARQALLEKGRTQLEDRVWRSYGVLCHSRLLTTKEAFERLSDVRLGASLSLLPGVDESVLNMLLMNVQAAHLQIAGGRTMTAPERDEARAEFVRDTLTHASEEGNQQ